MHRKQTLHFIDPNSRARAELSRLGFELGHHCEVYGGPAELAEVPPRSGIIVARDSVSSGGIPQLIEELGRHSVWLPLVAISDEPRTERVVAAVKAGALDYLRFPLDGHALNQCLARIADEAESFSDARRRLIEARARIASLSNRERQVLEWLARGSSNKTIAHELDISPRTVEIHRANMMSKLGAQHPADAVRIHIEASLDGKAA